MPHKKAPAKYDRQVLMLTWDSLYLIKLGCAFLISYLNVKMIASVISKVREIFRAQG